MLYLYPNEAHQQAGIPVQGRSWSEATYSDENLAEVVLENCSFERVIFERADLRRTVFVNCRIDRCEFRDCLLGETLFNDCSGAGARIQGGELFSVVIANARWDRLAIEQSGANCVISESEFDQLDFNGAGAEQQALTLSGTSFKQLNGENAAWIDATAVDLELGNCNFAGASFKRAGLIGVKARNLDLSGVRFESCNLFRSDFSGSRLRHAPGSIFAEAILEESDFSHAELDGALFANASAAKACFDKAQLTGALFPKATLHEAFFRDASAHASVWTEADLRGANLAGLDAFRGIFRHADLDGADVTGASFAHADLHGVKQNLEDADTRDARGTLAWRAEMERQSVTP